MEAFLNYLQYEKRVSPHTVKAYRTDLEQFAAYLQKEFGENDIRKVDSADVRAWMMQLMEGGDSPRSVNRKISALRAFFRYHVRMGDVEANPMEAISAPKIAKRLPQFVSQGEMDTLFRAELFEDAFEGWRDRLIIELFYVTGMRLSELVNLKRSDIDLYDGSLKVMGKRSKERIIPFSPRVKEVIVRYLEIFDEKYAGNSKNSFIFVAPNGNKIYPKAVYRIVRKYLDMVTTIDKRSPHVLRHTFATQMLNNGADINAIKEILGHSSLAATQVYTHNTIEKLKNIYNQAHPRA